MVCGLSDLSNTVMNIHDSKIYKIPSQTTVDERVALVCLSRDIYSGTGKIFDIGTAAGGSTYCLASGLNENKRVDEKNNVIYGFDLFGGYSLNAFRRNAHFIEMERARDEPYSKDLELFLDVVHPFQASVCPVEGDLHSELLVYGGEKIEIAHIDAAKSLSLWSVICPVISKGVVSTGSFWVFQDFERCRLPWQWLFVAELLREGVAQWSGFYKNGTAHLKINGPVPEEIVHRSAAFDYSEAHALALWELIVEEVASHPDREEAFCGSFKDVGVGVLAYIYKQLGMREECMFQCQQLSQKFLQDQAVYERELSEFLGVNVRGLNRNSP